MQCGFAATLASRTIAPDTSSNLETLATIAQHVHAAWWTPTSALDSDTTFDDWDGQSKNLAPTTTAWSSVPNSCFHRRALTVGRRPPPAHNEDAG